MNLEKKDIEYGFWNPKNRNPEYLTFDNDKIYEVKNLGIEFKDEQNTTNEIKIWNKSLEKLESVEYIWTYHKLNQTTFESMCRMKNLKGINIKWSSIKDTECLKNLAGLKHLNIGLSTNIQKIEPICSLPNLITFESENLKNVDDWGFLTNQVQLEGLGISGGTYERLKLSSLDFLRNLKNLKYLYLISTNISNKSLKPIYNIKGLENLILTNDWEDEELRKLKQNLPNLKFGSVVQNNQTKYLQRIFRK